MYINTYVYAYIYVNIHIYINIYIYIYTNKSIIKVLASLCLLRLRRR